MSEPAKRFYVKDYRHPDDPPDDWSPAIQRALDAAAKHGQARLGKRTLWQRLKARAARLRRRG